MKVDEATLDSWSNQGSKVQSAQTYQTIKNVLENSSSPYYSKNFVVFLQGSYGNDTNIYADSDVDIIICLTSIYYPGTGYLEPSEKSLYESLSSAGGYSLNEFKGSVVEWLRQNFGQSVEVGNKAIFIRGNSSRRDADVLVCAEYREYWSYKSAYSSDFATGIVFWTLAGAKIINYPQRHRDNLTSRNQEHHSRLKPLVRIIKNLRNRMTDQQALTVGKAPSYFVEGLLWNMPYERYSYTHRGTVDGYVSWVGQLDVANLTCANGIHWLVRPNYSTSWKTDDFETYRNALRTYWA